MKRKVLHLVLTFKWFDLTASGEKRIEYRQMTLNWMRRIWAPRRTITHVRFARGYTSRTKAYKVTKIDVGPCPIDGWDGDFIRIHFEDEGRGAEGGPDACNPPAVYI